MKTITINQLPPPDLTTVRAVKAFWKTQIGESYKDPTVQVTVKLPRQGLGKHLTAVSQAALALQKEMGASRFHFTDKKN